MNQKGFIPVIVLIIALVVGAAGGVYYLSKTKVARPQYQNSQLLPPTNPNQASNHQQSTPFGINITTSLSSSSASPSLKPTANPFPGLTYPVVSTTISDQEKQLIDLWIQKNNLNQYGDLQGTSYTGGSSLFSESTGVTIDRYQYIFSKHPDKPWDQQ